MGKIALVGTVCTGKTTVFNQLKKTFVLTSPTIFVREAAGEYFASNKPHNMFAHEVNIGIQDLIIKKERQAELQGSVIICDRSVLCPAVYSSAFGHDEGYRELLKRIENYIKTYDRFILMDPAGIPYVMANFRYEDEQTRLMIHEVYLRVLRELRLPWDLLSGSELERIEHVKSYIESHFISKEREL